MYEPEFYNGKAWSLHHSSGELYAKAPVDLVHHCQVTMSATEIMVMGGRNPAGYVKLDTAKYDFKSNTWNLLAPLPQDLFATP